MGVGGGRGCEFSPSILLGYDSESDNSLAGCLEEISADLGGIGVKGGREASLKKYARVYVPSKYMREPLSSKWPLKTLPRASHSSTSVSALLFLIHSDPTRFFSPPRPSTRLSARFTVALASLRIHADMLLTVK